ncbi:cadherin-like protein 26 [Betta splendens]|uniref:Cadherin-like protein 26 n=1 Tax=Betta splendens TaxID=158456 RepID=A0A6P7MJX1_BETSP|nr:cadherin-like protein 26 [Betta splendens]
MFCFMLLIYYLSSTTCSELLGRYRRAWIIDSFTIEEGHPGPFPYALGKINVERNYWIFYDIYGEGVNESPKGVISIDQEGTLFVHKPVDYEEKTLLKLTFEVRKGNHLIDTKLGVEIHIKDINDNPPRFNRDVYEIRVNERSKQGSSLLRLDAYDRDQRGTLNSTFHYEIKAASPNIADTQFFVDAAGNISFRGCLDYEAAKTFKLLVEVKDHGDVVSLSSSATVVIHIQDGNNHLPTVVGQTGSGKVREEETGSSPLRLHVADEDTRNSPAWRARFIIRGDEGGHFKMETDPNTNDGVLTVVRPLNFEAGARRELTITVENQAPYFSCKVVERTASPLWTVDTGGSGGPHSVPQPHSVNVTVEVEDINDPPVFSVAAKEAVLKENSPLGTWVEKVTAVDADATLSRSFLYKVGSDPAGWVTVDPHTGDVTTIKTPDRESPHVVDGIYTIVLLAVDDGSPPATGTTTLHIHVSDQNDHAPQLTAERLDVCESDGLANITAFDLDESPFGGPFTFELLGDVKGKWKLKPSYGYTAGLVKQPGVFAGQHIITLKISDMQGEFVVYNLSVTICDCSGTSACRTQRSGGPKAAPRALGIMLASWFLFPILLLTAVVVSCKKEFASLQIDDSETLLESNTETPGTDCKVPDWVHHSPVVSSVEHKHPPKRHNLSNEEQCTTVSRTTHMEKSICENYLDYRRENISYQFQPSDTWNHQHVFSVKEDMNTTDFLYETDVSYMMESTVLALLHWRLSTLQANEDNQDYEPHVYAEEGDANDLLELEDVTLPDEDELFRKTLSNLGSKFNQLASICQPSVKN